jgi:glycosyltransferase involved in cell wall biosynthesis
VKPSLSVVIPAYNRSAELRRVLESLALQTVKEFEVVVCDDGSSEDIPAVLLPFKEQLAVQYVRIPNSGGPARPRNTAIAAARGDWIALLDSDDWWDPNYIERMQQQLADSCDVAYCRLRVVHARGAEQQGEQRQWVGDAFDGELLRQMIVIGNPIANSAAVVRKAAFEQMGGLCEDRALSAVEDFDLWLRLAEAGMRFKFVDEVLGSYWVGIDNISTISSKQIDREVALHQRHRVLFPPGLRSIAEACFHDRVGGLYLRSQKYGDAIAHLKLARPLPGFRRPVRRLLKLFSSYWKRGKTR